MTTSVPPKLFISYTHDSVQHSDKILALADRLRADGIDAQIDQYVWAPPEGWVRWMRREIKKADFVIAICTDTYKRRAEGDEKPGKGRGGDREGLIIDQAIYDSNGGNKKFIPAVVSNADRKFVPDFLRPYEIESTETESGYEKLYRRLTDQPEVVKPALGKLRSLPPRHRKTTSNDRRSAVTREAPDLLPVQSNDLLTGPLTISAVLKGPERQIVGDAYPTGDNGVHFVFSIFNGNTFDVLVNELDVDVLAYAPLNLDHLAHGVGATAVRRKFRATIRPESGSYVATYVGPQGEFVTIPPGKSEGLDVEISTRTEGLYDICLRVHGGSAGKGFDTPLDSTKRRIAFFDRGAGYMVDRGLGGRMLTYDEYSLEMKSWGPSDY